jgi:hypothetical protein
MFLSFRGFTSPQPRIGAIYPLQIHGGTVYVYRWEHYMCSSVAFGVAFILMAFAYYLQRVLGRK